MKWFREELEDIYQPYNVRGLYNKNRMLILESELYDEVMDKLDKLKKIHKNSKLDLTTIEGIKEDIEVDKTSLALIREEAMKRQRTINMNFDYDDYRKTIKESETRQINQVINKQKPKPKEVFESDNLVTVEFENVDTNVLEVVEKEVIRKALEMCSSKTEVARWLGISCRTLTNKINRHFRNQ